MKYLLWLLKAAIFFTLFAFALNNQQTVCEFSLSPMGASVHARARRAGRFRGRADCRHAGDGAPLVEAAQHSGQAQQDRSCR